MEKNGYFRVADGFCKVPADDLWGISSRKCLKIGDITRHRGFLAANLRLTEKPFPCKQLFAFLNLFRDGLVPGCGKITGTARTAEDTASCIDQSVPVGAGKAAVKASSQSYKSCARTGPSSRNRESGNAYLPTKLHSS